MRKIWPHNDLPAGTLDVLDIEQVELKGFSRSIAEIEWLLLLLVVLYCVSPGAEVDSLAGVVLATGLFAVFVFTFHYINSEALPTRWKLAIETWAMIGYITWVVWNTGNTGSPVISLYLLVIIFSAITLGRVTTFLEIALIGAFYFYLAVQSSGELAFSFIGFSQSMIYFAPFVLVAYITSMLVADVNYGKKMLKALSQLDEMTSLLNKRAFMPLFAQAAEMSVRYGHPLTVMKVGADNLKQVNERYGPEAGDRLITTIAMTLQDSLRASDIICRFSGDEFVALLPNQGPQRAREVAERLRLAVANTSFDKGGVRVSTTVSIGTVTCPDEVEDVNELLEKADEALDVSKQVGRNTTTSYAMITREEMVDAGTDVPVGG